MAKHPQSHGVHGILRVYFEMQRYKLILYWQIFFLLVFCSPARLRRAKSRKSGKFIFCQGTGRLKSRRFLQGIACCACDGLFLRLARSWVSCLLRLRWIVFMAKLKTYSFLHRPSTFRFPLSTFRFPLSTFRFPLSTFCFPLPPKDSFPYAVNFFCRFCVYIVVGVWRSGTNGEADGRVENGLLSMFNKNYFVYMKKSVYICV